MDLFLTLTGFVVGFVVGLTGVGGGSLMTPALILFFGIKPAVAVGTDLLYAAITKSGGVLVHHYKQSIHWRVVLLMAAGSIPATAVAVVLLKHLQASGIDYQGLIMVVLGNTLCLTGIFLLLQKWLRSISEEEAYLPLRWLHTLRTPLTVIAGFCIGLLVCLSSVGAGVIGAVFFTVVISGDAADTCCRY